MRIRSTWPLLASLGMSCQPQPGDYWKAREACDLHEGDDLWQDSVGLGIYQDDGEGGLVTHWRPVHPMSQSCLDHLSRDLGVDWDQWDQGAQGLSLYEPDQRVRTIDTVLVGLWTILAMDLGPISTELERTDRPPAFTADIKRYLNQTPLKESDSVSAALYMTITESIHEVEPGARHSWVYFRKSGTLQIKESKDFGPPSGLTQAIELAQQAGSRYGRADVDCNTIYPKTTNGVAQPFCARDADSGMGLQSWVSHRMWLKAQPLMAIQQSGHRVLGFGEGGGGSAAIALSRDCMMVADLSHMDYCFDPDVQDWARWLTLDERYDMQ